MINRSFFLAVLLAVCLVGAAAQPVAERVDTAAVLKIKDEGLNHSQVMKLLSRLCDVEGPRLTWSPEYRHAADWASKQLTSWGLSNVHFENWAPVGIGWSLKQFTARVVSPVPFTLIGVPKAWSADMGDKEAEVVYLDVKTLDDFKKYEGKLKGKFVFLNPPVDLKAPFEPFAERTADSLLLRMANADVQGGRRGGRGGRMPRITMTNFDSVMTFAKQFMPNIDSAGVARLITEQTVTPRKLQFAQEQGAAAAFSAGRGDGGLLFVQQATVPQPADVPFNQRINAYDPNAPEILPQVVLAAEQYNRIVRMIELGEKVKMAVELDVKTTKADSGFNIIAEIPGTDLKDEVVMIGGHFDSWHGGTGATDNGAGTAVSMEAMRILEKMIKEQGFKPRRTIRIGLWGGEEEGLFGSRGYAAAHLGKSEGDAMSQMMGMGGGAVKTLPEHEKFSVYFNDDNGIGRFRGVYMQGNEAVRPIFRAWLKVYGDPGAQTLTLQNTGGTDHLSFDGVGIPGFQFIQDPIDYETRTHHSNMDVFERAQPEEMKQAATMMAVFAYNAAMRDAKFPRKPMPAGR